MIKFILALTLIIAAQLANATPPSLWQTIRSGFQLNHHTNKPRVQYFIRYYQKHPQLLHDVIMQSKPFLYLVVKQTQKLDLPTELALVPIIESAFHNTATSDVGASGAWQLMPGTAENYGIYINSSWYDGRQEIINSTAGALTYLRYLHNYFDSNWLLALAAYNAGEGNVAQAIHYNLVKHRNTDFWYLNLPQQTRLYVPKLLAFAAIINNPNYYGIKLPPISAQAIVAPVFLPRQMSLIRSAHFAGISLANLQKLNPAYKQLITPPHGTYDLLLPINHVVEFEKNLAIHANPNSRTWHLYTVKPGDTLSTIASRTNIGVRTLMYYNRLYGSRINVGQRLIVPKHMH